MKIFLRIFVFLVVAAGSVWAFFYVLKGISIPTLPEIEDIVPIKIGSAPEINTSKNTDGEQINSAIPALPENENNITRISNGSVFDYVIVSDKEIYYFTNTGKVFQARLDGDVAIMDQELGSLNSVSQSPQGNRALVAWGDPKKPSWNIYDVLDKAWRPLPKDIVLAAWGANDETLLVISEKEGVRTLQKISLARNAITPTIIFPNFTMRDISFHVIDGDTFTILDRPSAFHAGNLYILNTQTLAMKRVIRETNGLSANFLSSFWILFSSPEKITLAKTGGETIRDLALRTIPQKCGGGKEIYCFAARELPEGTILPDDIFKNKFYSVDGLYRVQENGESELVFESGQGEVPEFDGYSVRVTNNYVYFINKHDRALYRVGKNILSSQNGN
jgi:WD40 repeat protein